MAERRTGTRTKRTDAREQRRSLLTQPFEQLAEKAREAGSDGETSPIAKTVAAAATAAAAAGLAGAAKALLTRHRNDDEPQDDPEREEPEAERDDEEQQPDAEAGEQDEAEAEEPQPGATSSDDDEDDDEVEGNEEPEAGAEDEAEEPEAEHDDDRPDRHEPEAERGEEGEDGRDGADGASRGDVARIVAAARKGLEEMLDHDVESVSGFERSDDGWCVTLEVVEVRRIPDSTDVLCSYRVLLDDDRQLVRLDRTHRYRRSQVDAE